MLAEETFPLLPVNFEENNPLDARFASLARISFVIAASFFSLYTVSSSISSGLYKKRNGH
jgi:hypothetical protein